MFKAGIYQTIMPHAFFEKHGGGKIKHTIFWNLCFYPDSPRVGLFGGRKNNLRPYESEQYDLKGEITELNNSYIELYITNPYANAKKIYKGRIEGDRLYLQSHYENNPLELSEEVFEFVQGSGTVQDSY